MEESKKMPHLERILILLAILLFFGVCTIIIFRRDWVDSVLNIEREDTQEVDSDFGIDSDVRYAILDIVTDHNNEASVYLYLDDIFNIAGLDIAFAKAAELEILEFNCEEPFECVEVEFDEYNFSVVTIIPIDYEGDLTGEVLVGSFRYSGSGDMYLINDDSVVATSDDSNLELFGGEFTIL